MDPEAMRGDATRGDTMQPVPTELPDTHLQPPGLLPVRNSASQAVISTLCMASETNFHYEADDSLTFVDVAHVDKRIVGGTNVVQGTYTWAVKSTYLWSDQSISICSGSILSNKWILTAAHCCVHPHRQVIRSVIEAGNPNVA
ncbi:hypothetical protein T265_15205, partial [Opisthorchis viverrini]